MLKNSAKCLILIAALLLTLTPVSAQEIYRGIIFETDPENLAEITNALNLAGVEIGLDEIQRSLAQFGAEIPIGGLMLSEDRVFVLISDEKLESGSYEIVGGALFPIEINGYYYTPLKVFEYRKLPAEEVKLSELKANPENYLFKEIKLTATLTEFSFTLDYEGVLIPVSVGLLSDVEPDPEKFAGELVNITKDVLADPSWEKVSGVMGKYSGIPTFRIKEGYWKNARAEVTGFVITPDLLDAWLSLALIDPSNLERILPAGKVVVFLNDVNVVSERAEVPDILSNPDTYAGKVVEVETCGMGVDISVRRLLQAVSAPTLVGPVAQEFVQRVNVFLEGEVVWKPVTPDVGNLLYASGTRSYSKRPIDTLIIPINEVDGRFVVKGAVVSASRLNPELSDTPMLLVFEKKRVGDVAARELSSDVKEKILERLNELEKVLAGKSEENKKIDDSVSETSETSTASMPSFSQQQESGKTPEPETPSGGSTETTPGFEIIAAIAAMGAVCLWRFRKQ